MDKNGGSVASLNAPLKAEPIDRRIADGSAGRDAGTKSGLESGCFKKETFSNTAVEQLGKPIHGMGTVAWDAPPRDSVGAAVGAGEFGHGQRHTIKNG
jgi:hypothetical protein